MIIALFNSVGSLSDEKLMEKFRESGNSWYVGELYKRYSHPVTAICLSYFKNREETEDAVMEVFEMVLSDLKRYDVQSFKPWLLTVVRHYCIRKKDKARKESGQHADLKKNKDHFMELSHELSLDHIDGEVSPDLRAELEKAMSQLKEEQKVCVELFFLQDKSYQQIAEITGFPLHKVKSYIQNGKRNLKIYLESLNG